MSHDRLGSLPVLGVTGMPGAGKTTFSQILGAGNGEVIDLDQEAHEVLKLSEVKDKLKEAFGAGIFEAGEVSRARLADAAFKDENSIAKLNAITHPAILRRMKELMQRELSLGAFWVLDVPLLCETQFYRSCQLVLLVDAPQETRWERLSQQRGWSQEECERREKGHDLHLKRSRSDLILKSEWCREDLEKKALELELALRYNGSKNFGAPDWAQSISGYLSRQFKWK